MDYEYIHILNRYENRCGTYMNLRLYSIHTTNIWQVCEKSMTTYDTYMRHIYIYIYEMHDIWCKYDNAMTHICQIDNGTMTSV